MLIAGGKQALVLLILQLHFLQLSLIHQIILPLDLWYVLLSGSVILGRRVLLRLFLCGWRKRLRFVKIVHGFGRVIDKLIHDFVCQILFIDGNGFSLILIKL